MAPRIGISTYWRGASWGPWTDYPAAIVPQGYILGVRAAGGVPLLIPPDPSYSEDAATVLDAVHALLVVGGEDIDAAVYGAVAHPTNDPPNPVRDGAELALVRAARERDMPFLGICRGFQMLNIAYGGDLVQHLAEERDMTPHRPTPGEFGRHDVEVRGGRLREIAGGRVEQIHSHHHQGLGRVGAGLEVTGVAEDGLIEAIEDPSRRFCVGVLWHPEEEPTGAGAPFFRALVEQAARYQSRQSEE